MPERINWKCPECGKVNDIICGTAPAKVLFNGVVEEGRVFEPWIDPDMNDLGDIADQDKIVWYCPHCEHEFLELKSDQDIEDFIRKNRTQMKMEEKGG
jgi:rubredoxin